MPKLGLIAGNGRFPFLVLDAARPQGHDVVVAAIKKRRPGNRISWRGSGPKFQLAKQCKSGAPSVMVAFNEGPSVREGSMQEKTLTFLALAFFALVVLPYATCQTQAEKASSPTTSYPAASYQNMAPLDQYQMPDVNSEIALARSGAPASISDAAEVMVLGAKGYTTAVKGTNGFLCIVERSWGAATDEPEFWNPKVRAPICFNPQAAKTFAPIFLVKTRLVLAGKSKQEIVEATASALDRNELPALEPGAMCYMLSRQQYLNDRGMSWHPHVMFFVRGDVAQTWGADLPGSPVLPADDPEERATIFMVMIGKWSDGTPAPDITH